MSSITFVIGGFLSVVTCAVLAASIADGRSLFVGDGLYLEGPNFPNIGDRYAVGVAHDTLGRTWQDAGHLFNIEGCITHKERGETVMAFTLMGCILTGLAAICHLLGADSGKGLYGKAAAALNISAAVCLGIATSVTASLFDEGLSCTRKVASSINGQVLLRDVQRTVNMKDSFDLGYALPLMVGGCVASCVSAGVVLLRATSDIEEVDPGSPHSPTEPTAAAAEASPRG